jgi:2-phosphosulfolactate phosphatase
MGSRDAPAASFCEWGARGVDALMHNVDVVIVVDVLSFSTCTEIATARGAAVFPALWEGESAAALAERKGAVLAGPRSQAGISLSPVSLLGLGRGSRIVLPSLNGATLTLRAREKPVLAGCLRNASAVAEIAMQLGDKVAVIPAGEQWPDGHLRPAFEDWVGAGAILAHLPDRTTEAQAAVDVFLGARDRLVDRLLACTSGQELVGRGFEADVRLAAELDVSTCTPRLVDDAYQAWAPARPALSTS